MGKRKPPRWYDKKPHEIPISGTTDNGGRKDAEDFYAARRAAKASANPKLTAQLAGSKWRVPADAPEEAKKIAGMALQRIVEAMNGYYSPQMATAIVRAAVALRDDVCGPAAKTLNVQGKIGIAGILAKMEELETGEKPEVEEIEEAEIVEQPLLPPAIAGVEAKPPVVRRKRG